MNYRIAKKITEGKSSLWMNWDKLEKAKKIEAADSRFKNKYFVSNYTKKIHSEQVAKYKSR